MIRKIVQVEAEVLCSFVDIEAERPSGMSTLYLANFDAKVENEAVQNAKNCQFLHEKRAFLHDIDVLCAKLAADGSVSASGLRTAPRQRATAKSPSATSWSC
jgi:hypothetical protein